MTTPQRSLSTVSMLEGERKDRWQTFIIAFLHRFGCPSPTGRCNHLFDIRVMTWWSNSGEELFVEHYRLIWSPTLHLRLTGKTDTSLACDTENLSAEDDLLHPNKKEQSPLPVGAFHVPYRGQVQSKSCDLKQCVSRLLNRWTQWEWDVVTCLKSRKERHPFGETA